MNLTDFKTGMKIEIELMDKNGERIVPNFKSHFEWAVSEKIAVIAAPIREGVIYPVHIGSQIDIVVIEKDVFYKFKANVLSRGMKDNIAFLKIELAGDIAKVQRRNFFRFECAIPIRYKVAVSLVPEENDTIPYIESITRDVSGGGLSIMVMEKLNLNDMLLCQLILSDNKYIQFIGKVVRSIKYTVEGKYPYEAGVCFSKIENRDIDAIVGYIFGEQKRLRKRGLI